ncbi:MAG: 3-oxoacyl-[acyl-carrier-protein] synthase 3 [marine bacterium B5-7]|nr:MAG: 3-oxoacyl-[acyl-carrier-protein] synthase 3 [marine bacterium B5-7]
MYSRIIGTGSYLPSRIVDNHELERMVDTSDEWIRTRTGIVQRHIAAEGEFTSDLAEAAARRAIDAAGIDPNEIDLIVVATTTPDLVFPSTATLVQHRLGIRGCPAFDIQAVCAGFMYALDIVDKYIRTGAAHNVLVIGAETFSRIIDWTDRNTCVLFGDGAGAMVIRADEEHGILSSHIHADGAYKELLWVPVGVSNGGAELEAGRAFTRMKGNEVFRWAVNAMSDIALDALKHNNMSVDEVDWVVPHQANVRIIHAIGKRLGVSPDKLVITVCDHGNTSAASVPLAFDVAVRDGRFKPGDVILLEGFGGGFTWGSVLLRY